MAPRRLDKVHSCYVLNYHVTSLAIELSSCICDGEPGVKLAWKKKDVEILNKFCLFDFVLIRCLK